MITELYWDPSDQECVEDALEFMKQGEAVFYTEMTSTGERALVIHNDIYRDPTDMPEMTQAPLYVQPGQYVEFDGGTFGYGRRSKA